MQNLSQPSWTVRNAVTPRAAMPARPRLWQVLELVFDGIVRLDDPVAVERPLQRPGEAMVGLRADHQVDRGFAPQDLAAFRLSHAAGDADDRFQPAAWRARP